MIITPTSPVKFFSFFFHPSTKFYFSIFSHTPLNSQIGKSHKSILRRTWFVMCCSSSCCLVWWQRSSSLELMWIPFCGNVDIIVSVKDRTERIDRELPPAKRVTIITLLFFTFSHRIFYHYRVLTKKDYKARRVGTRKEFFSVKHWCVHQVNRKLRRSQSAWGHSNNWSWISWHLKFA